jgi:hypothetical protein
MLERVVLLEDGELLRPQNLPIVHQSGDDNLSAVRRLENTLVRTIPEEGVNFDKLISDVEVDLIVKASRQCNWNQSRTAELLQMKRDKLRYRMKIYSIESERRRGPGRPSQQGNTDPDASGAGMSEPRGDVDESGDMHATSNGAMNEVSESSRKS